MIPPSLLFDDPAFRDDFERLRAVSLNPERHLMRNAHDHSLAVAARAEALGAANDCPPANVALLRDLGLVHDIGKIGGTTSPAASVDLLPRYGLVDPGFVDLVRYHDVNLPWHLSIARRTPPTDKAWRKLASRVDVHLLCIFMIADRVDCPGGWRCNAPLVWFLGEAARRGHRPVDVPDVPAARAPAVTGPDAFAQPAGKTR
jgi:HD domain